MITMLSNLETGWSKLKIGDFTGIPSYITDVPVDLLTVFIDYYKKNTSAMLFDEEGSEFTIVLSNEFIYVIYFTQNCEAIFYEFPEIFINDLAKELIEDIENNLDSWSRFSASINSEEEISQERELLINLISELKGMIIHYA